MTMPPKPEPEPEPDIMKDDYQRRMGNSGNGGDLAKMGHWKKSAQHRNFNMERSKNEIL